MTAMTAQDDILTILKRWAKAPEITPDSVLFGSGLNMSSIAFTECVMEIEEHFGIDIDLDVLDDSIVTAGQLIDRLAGIVAAQTPT